MNKQSEPNPASSKILAQLITLNPNMAQSIDITSDSFSIGRSKVNCDSLINDNRISSQHLQINYSNNEFSITDLSTNGTYIKDSKIGKGNKVILKNNDLIYLLPSSKVSNEKQIIGFKFQEVKQTSKPESEVISGDPPTDKGPQQTNSEIKIDTPPAVPSKNEYDWLEDEIQCMICNDYMLESVTVNPCNHHFCGACLSSWLNKQKTECPTCRIQILGIMKAHTMNNLVDRYLTAHPDKTKPLQLIEKMKEENLIYRNPEKYAMIQNPGKQPKLKRKLWEDNGSDEEEDEEYNEDDEYLSNDENFNEAQPEQQYQLFRQNFVQQPPMFRFGKQFMQNAFQDGLFPAQAPNLFGVQFQDQRKLCKSCAGKQWKNFQCPDNQVHVGCGSCGRLMPKRILTDEENDKLQMFCCICKAHHCGFYYGDCVNAQMQKFMLVKGLEHQMVVPLNFINATEFEKIRKHLNGRPQTVIFKFMMDNYISKGLFYFQQNKQTFTNPLQEINVQITPETPVCWLCHRKLINFIIFRYVQCLKYDEPLFMDEDCHYGINCRHQLRDKYHAQKYNHCCEQTKFD